jgi:ribonuclease VapC
VIVIDTSVILAVFFREPEARAVVRQIRGTTRPRISAANLLEILIVLDARSRVSNRDRVERMIDRLGIEIEVVTASQVWLAAEAYRRFGKGFHPARLNYGDCFAYALARDLGFPLLYKGADFALTDIPAAAAA